MMNEKNRNWNIPMCRMDDPQVQDPHHQQYHLEIKQRDLWAVDKIKWGIKMVLKLMKCFREAYLGYQSLQTSRPEFLSCRTSSATMPPQK